LGRLRVEIEGAHLNGVTEGDMATLQRWGDRRAQGSFPALLDVSGCFDALAGRGGAGMLGDNQVFGANDDERRARIDTDARADKTGGHGINAIVKTHRRFRAHRATGCSRKR